MPRTLCIICLGFLCCFNIDLSAVERDAFIETVITLNQELDPNLDLAHLRTQYASLVETCKKSCAGLSEPVAIIAALNRALLHERKISYLSNVYWRDASLSAAVLQKNCNCLAGSTLYVCIGKSLALPIKMVLSPGHAFARWDNEQTRINIETTNKGVHYPDKNYLQGANQVSAEDNSVLRYCESLSDEECLAELKRIVAGEMFSRSQYTAGLALLEEPLAVMHYREDLQLYLLRMRADNSGNRDALRDALHQFIQSSRTATIKTQALLLLASEYSDQKRFDQQRSVLLEAFRVAPKTSTKGVLHALAFCHRSLKDYRGGRRYLELYGALVQRNSPEYASYLYNLAILQKNDEDLPAALLSIEQGIALNPESWNLQVIKAGYPCLSGETEQGLALFKTIEQPRGDLASWNIMQSWFYAVSKQESEFYAAFAHALETAKNPGILTWIAQDVDLDPYREQDAFNALLLKHRPRLIGN